MTDANDPYLQLVRDVFGDFPAESGCTQEELAAAETRLEVEIPKALKSFLSTVGRFDPVTSPFHRLFAADALEVHGDVLAFAEENQGVITWGADLEDGLDDPLVYKTSSASDEWHSEEIKLSAFAKVFTLWQAVNNGLPFCAVAAGRKPELVDRCDGEFELEAEHAGMRVYRGELCAAVLSLSAGQVAINFGAREEDAIDDMELALSLTWDWSTIDD